MGINGFQKWLYRYHSNSFKKVINTKCDYFCIDMNSIIHQKYNEFLMKEESYRDNIYEYIYKSICELIKKYKPIKKTIICIDGVAPLAKLNQQKMRRYRHMIFNDGTMLYNPNEISPGTQFMKELSKYLHDYMDKDKNVILSDNSCVGEGEQKIFKYLKEKINENDDIFIYGLDSDLFLLSYILNSNITLILDRNGDIDYFNINEFKTITNGIYSYDLVFLISLFGNDFIPDSPILSLYGNLNDVLQIYYIYYKNTNQYICPNGYININNLYIIFEMLKQYELKKIMEKKNNINFDTLIENINDIKIVNKQIDEIIENNKSMINKNDMNYNDFMNNYYINKLNITNKYKLNNVINMYLRMLQWVILYYKYNDPPSWMLSYNKQFSPFYCDITDYIYKYYYKLKLNEYKKNEPLKECEQLLYILPKNDIYKLLHNKYHDYVNINNKIYSEYKIELYNVYNKNKCIILLNNIDINDIKKYCDNLL